MRGRVVGIARKNVTFNRHHTLLGISTAPPVLLLSLRRANLNPRLTLKRSLGKLKQLLLVSTPPSHPTVQYGDVAVVERDEVYKVLVIVGKIPPDESDHVVVESVHFNLLLLRRQDPCTILSSRHRLQCLVSFQNLRHV